MNTLFSTIATLTSQGFRVSFSANTEKIRVRVADPSNDGARVDFDVLFDKVTEHSDEKIAEDLRRSASMLKRGG